MASARPVRGDAPRRRLRVPRLGLLLGLAAAALPPATAPALEPTIDGAGNCGIFGEDNSVPPVPRTLLLSCDGSPIVGVSYAVYGQPKGKCGDADFGSGSAGAFEDTNPQCKGMDLMAKMTALCVGKPSCTLACPVEVPCNGARTSLLRAPRSAAASLPRPPHTLFLPQTSLAAARTRALTFTNGPPSSSTAPRAGAGGSSCSSALARVAMSAASRCTATRSKARRSVGRHCLTQHSGRRCAPCSRMESCLPRRKRWQGRRAALLRQLETGLRACLRAGARQEQRATSQQRQRPLHRLPPPVPRGQAGAARHRHRGAKARKIASSNERRLSPPADPTR